MAGLLLAFGAVGSYALAGLLFVLVLFALPSDGMLARLAGGVLAVVVTRTWPTGVPIPVATAEQAERGVAFSRVFVAGALLAEAAFVLWRARDRD